MTSPSTAARTRARKVRRRPPTLLVVAAGAATVTLVGLTVPAAGSQLGLSLTRRPGTWTELYFPGADASVGSAGCRVAGQQVTVRFALGSHQHSAHRIAFRVVVRPARGTGAQRVARNDSRLVGAGRTSIVTTTLAAASSGVQEIAVTLPSTGAEITSRCEEL